MFNSASPIVESFKILQGEEVTEPSQRQDKAITRVREYALMVLQRQL